MLINPTVDFLKQAVEKVTASYSKEITEKSSYSVRQLQEAGHHSRSQMFYNNEN